MKEYTLLQRVVMILKVIFSIFNWVSRILFKIVRGMLPGADKSPSTASTTSGANSSSAGPT